MNSARADALRLILPLLPRLATVDFLGTDDLGECIAVHLGFDDVECDLVDDDQDDDREDRPLFCAVTSCNGSKRATTASATPIHLYIRNLLSGCELSSVQRFRAS